MLREQRSSLRGWVGSGEPWIWFNAAAVGISIAAVVGILLLIAVRGMAHFWPTSLALISYQNDAGEAQVALGEVTDVEYLPVGQFVESNPRAADTVPEGQVEVERWLVKTGNRRAEAPDFRWIVAHRITDVTYPSEAIVLEREEWGNAYGYLRAVYQGDELSSRGPAAWTDLQQRIERVNGLRERVDALEGGRLFSINYDLERLRLERRAVELQDLDPPARRQREAGLSARESELQAEYEQAESQLRSVRQELDRDSIRVETARGTELSVPLAQIMRAWKPNQMGALARFGHFARSAWLFLSQPPREANTEGGVFPALFGTVMMVLLMSVLVTPFGVVAAVYLREYAHQGPFVRLIRIAVNNLAGVPSIVYGVFGLGFFVYFLGGSLDALFFPEALPSPTFGTPGLLWASLTLALLTVPVVIVSTEEGLTRIPRSLREGSLALGATKAETLFKVVLPVASPSILTGVILAVARAAGEVAPLMLVGVVKLAPALPVDGNFPYLHLERKFMHLGFHIYDVGFQSPNVEAARPLVYATALLLVILIIVLNLTAIMLRNRLENRYRGVEG